MANKAKFQAIKGTRDLLPPETELWNRVEQTSREVFATYGFGEIRPPIFEPTELFARAVGGDTDIVSKEMYSFEDRDETSVSLRPEATASVCRAYIEHKMHAAAGAREAVLSWTDVSAGAATEGAIPAVLPD